MSKGCVACYEISTEPISVSSGRLICEKCGGTVMNIQEALDHIAELKSQLSYIKETTEDGRWAL